MDTLNFIFRLGVIFAIFGFLWWIINTGFNLIRGGRPKTQAETYILKFVRYFFLVDVTILFCLDLENWNIHLPRLIIAGAVLLMYFLGKLQNAQFKRAFVQLQGALLNKGKEDVFSKKSEKLVVVLALAFFVFFSLQPNYAQNPVSTWFYDSILNIEDTPVFGFVFKIIGFFFMISIIMKMVNALNILVSGGGKSGDDNFPDSNLQRAEDDFDDYEEVE